MNTLFILHGGNVGKNNRANDDFFSCFTHYVKNDTVNILLCYFARDKHEWETLAKRDTNLIKKQTDKTISTSIAQTPKDLFAKLLTHDVLYVAGGEATNIETLYPELQQLKYALAGKIYIGSSMGAFMVSTNYILSFPRQRDLSVHKGLGILPVSTLCHWDIEKEQEIKVSLVQKENPAMPLMLLDECKHTMLMHNLPVLLA